MLTSVTTIVRYAATFGLAAGAAGIAGTLAGLEPLRRPVTGVRGEMRKHVTSSSASFRLLEPILLVVGGWVRGLCAASSIDGAMRQASTGEVCPDEKRGLVRAYLSWQEAQLTIAGRVWGLDAYELTALASCSAFVCFCAAASLVVVMGHGGVWIFPAATLGAALPNLRLQTTIAERFKGAIRNLPATIDLAALCMSAGSDFAQSLRYIVDGGTDPLTEELRRVLRALEVGHTRKAALLGLAERLPVDPVRDLVRALVQAEESGTPLAEALQNQARTERTRRSVAAEEAAARAGVLMILPLMLLLGCVVLLLLGPFIVNGGGL